jgi:hypothetical protein
MQSTPIETFRSWYLKQPKEVQETVGLCILVKVPRFSGDALNSLSRPIEAFLRYLDDIPDAASAVIGETLLIRAIVDFSVMRQFGSEHDWDTKKELNENIAADLEKEHGPNPMTDHLRQMIEFFPQRQELWSSTAKVWRIFRNTELSDEFLEAWERNHRPTR